MPMLIRRGRPRHPLMPLTWETGKMKKLLAFTFAALLGVGLAHAAVTPNSGVGPQTPNGGFVQFLSGTDVAGTYKTLYTGATNGSKCMGMWSTNNDSATHLITVQIVSSAVKYGGMAITSVA